jgi:hypothetical protein
MNHSSKSDKLFSDLEPVGRAGKAVIISGWSRPIGDRGLEQKLYNSLSLRMSQGQSGCIYKMPGHL